MHTITSSNIATSTSCTFCLSLKIEIWDPGYDDLGVDAIKALLFHEPCLRCDHPDSTAYVTLCRWCRHLRLHHLLVCHGRRYISLLEPQLPIRIILGACSRPRERCDSCSFLRAGRVDPWRATFPHRSILTARPDGDWDLSSELFDLHIIRVLSRSNRSFHVRPYIKWRSLRKQLARKDLRTREPEKGLELAFNQELQKVRVIDVPNRCIVILPRNATYYALSYVWGTEKESTVRCQSSNLHILEQSQSLTKKLLPQTIFDAMQVCQQLGQRFLWVDRFCIVQDDPEISVQLEQMGTIYHRAALTIVATGPGASHGLPGVSYARITKGSWIRYNKHVELVHGIPEIEHCLSDTPWQHRAWTFQEKQASSQLLHFTEYGIYYYAHENRVKRVYAEGALDGESDVQTEYGLGMIECYSIRELTYISDKLRAVSGIMNAMYGNDSYYGMPFVDIDIAILWRDWETDNVIEAPMFPSWSWLACPGHVRFLETRSMYGLGHWGYASHKERGDNLTSRWQLIHRGVRNFRHTRVNHRDGVDFEDDFRVSAAIAWLHGCSSVKRPEWLTMDLTRGELAKRLDEKMCLQDSEHCNILLLDGEVHDFFEHTESQKLIASSRIITHTQKTTFSAEPWPQDDPVDAYTKNHRPHQIVRTPTGRFAGIVWLDRRVSADLFQVGRRIKAEFIAISVTGETRYMPHLSRDESLSEIFGCPCATVDEDSESVEHIVECPEHVNFYTTEYAWEEIGEIVRKQYPAVMRRALAGNHYRMTQTFCDHHGQPLHPYRNPPVLHVIMIRKKQGCDGKDGDVYERIGVGEIYLKSWIAACPVFENIVLE